MFDYTVINFLPSNFLSNRVFFMCCIILSSEQKLGFTLFVVGCMSLKSIALYFFTSCFLSQWTKSVQIAFLDLDLTKKMYF